MKKSKTGRGINSVLARHERNGELESFNSITTYNGLYTRLHFTVETSSANLLRKLLENDPQAINDISFPKAVLLELAALSGDFEICEILMSYMSVEEIYCIRTGRFTTLSLIAAKDCITQEDLKIFRTLIEKIPENMLSIISRTELLHKVALRGHMEMCDIIIQKKPDTIRDVDDYGCAAIHIASYKGHLELVKWFIGKMRAEDVYNFLLTEGELHEQAKLGVQGSNPANNNATILKAVSCMIYNHIRKHTNIPFPSREDDGFNSHLKLTKLYKRILIEDSFKTYLVYFKERDPESFSNVDAHIPLISDLNTDINWDCQ